MSCNHLSKAEGFHNLSGTSLAAMNAILSNLYFALFNWWVSLRLLAERSMITAHLWYQFTTGLEHLQSSTHWYDVPWVWRTTEPPTSICQTEVLVHHFHCCYSQIYSFTGRTFSDVLSQIVGVNLPIFKFHKKPNLQTTRYQRREFCIERRPDQRPVFIFIPSHWIYIVFDQTFRSKQKTPSVCGCSTCFHSGGNTKCVPLESTSELPVRGFVSALPQPTNFFWREEICSFPHSRRVNLILAQKRPLGTNFRFMSVFSLLFWHEDEILDCFVSVLMHLTPTLSVGSIWLDTWEMLSSFASCLTAVKHQSLWQAQVWNLASGRSRRISSVVPTAPISCQDLDVTLCEILIRKVYVWRNAERHHASSLSEQAQLSWELGFSDEKVQSATDCICWVRGAFKFFLHSDKRCLQWPHEPKKLSVWLLTPCWEERVLSTRSLHSSLPASLLHVWEGPQPPEFCFCGVERQAAKFDDRFTSTEQNKTKTRISLFCLSGLLQRDDNQNFSSLSRSVRVCLTYDEQTADGATQ